MACNCKKKSITPTAQPAVKSVETTPKPIQTPIEAADVDNSTLITKITTRLKEITR